MELSNQQDQALKAVKEWLDNGSKPWFYLAGVAGTGKTTLARYFAENVSGEVVFAAFTGKAAHVLREKGCPNASTIHQLIYRAKDKPQTRLVALEARLLGLMNQDKQDDTAISRLRLAILQEREALARPAFDLKETSPLARARLLIVDEASMIDDRVGQDLLDFGVKTLVLGDPAQLPPVRGRGFFAQHEPDFMLTEIHRQARDNPIIRLSMQIREGGFLEEGTYGDSIVARNPDQDQRLEWAMQADQILCGRNATRHTGNKRMREELGHSGIFPCAKERLVCGKNNHEEGLLNGAIWVVDEPGVHDADTCWFSAHPEGYPKSVTTLEAHAAFFMGNEQDYPWTDLKNANKFEYGYMLTVHKAQGSQWPRVMLMDESRCFRDDARAWLYTGVTRAAEAVTVIL